MIERTAAAVNDQVRVAREALRPSFQIGESLLGLRGAMKHRTRHVSAHIKRAKTDAHDNQASRRLLIRRVGLSICRVL